MLTMPCHAVLTLSVMAAAGRCITDAHSTNSSSLTWVPSVTVMGFNGLLLPHVPEMENRATKQQWASQHWGSTTAAAVEPDTIQVNIRRNQGWPALAGRTCIHTAGCFRDWAGDHTCCSHMWRPNSRLVQCNWLGGMLININHHQGLDLQQARHWQQLNQTQCQHHMQATWSHQLCSTTSQATAECSLECSQCPSAA